MRLKKIEGRKSMFANNVTIKQFFSSQFAVRAVFDSNMSAHRNAYYDNVINYTIYQ